MSRSSLPSFPRAQQAQIIRANQRDLYHVSFLKEQTESVLRSWLGTRWLTRWDKEVDVLVKLGYYGLTTGRTIQTLGEEYTDIWQHSASNYLPPSPSARAALILLPTVPSYIMARWGTGVSAKWPWLKMLPTMLEVTSEANLAVFYLRGTYYDLVKRLLGIRHISSIPENPHTQPPSYSLLGVLLAVRLLYRLIRVLRGISPIGTSKDEGKKTSSSNSLHETYLDSTPISTFLGPNNPESEPAKPAEQDIRTALTISSIPPALRAGRSCTLCLEERTDSCATECGHLFCWSCIVGWGREKAECPLCRQGLKLSALLPIYNL